MYFKCIASRLPILITMKIAEIIYEMVYMSFRDYVLKFCILAFTKMEWKLVFFNVLSKTLRVLVAIGRAKTTYEIVCKLAHMF